MSILEAQIFGNSLVSVVKEGDPETPMDSMALLGGAGGPNLNPLRPSWTPSCRSRRSGSSRGKMCLHFLSDLPTPWCPLFLPACFLDKFKARVLMTKNRLCNNNTDKNNSTNTDTHINNQNKNNNKNTR